MSQAVVIGNGESRANINLNLIKDTSVLIGCNAIHRDMIVDHLICCDRRMIEEAVKNPNTINTIIYVREDWFKYYRKIQKRKNIQQVPDLPFSGDLKQDQPNHWGSGGYAVLLAATLGFSEIKLVGFDLYSKDTKVNNLYKGTENYSAPSSQSVDYSYWIYQLSKIFLQYPNIKFTIFNTADWQMPVQWQQTNVEFENISTIAVDL